jgi:hypothetical protein
MIQNLSIACSGVVLFGYVVIGLFFYRFWHRTGARLFAAFALAFFVLALERGMLLTEAVERIHEPLIYLTRLCSFLIIAWAIWDTSRRRRT